MGRLTTHVLDTANGRPAAGVRLVLRRDGEAAVLADTTTNSDGRVDGPLLEGAAFKFGRYVIEFHIGDYYRVSGTPLTDPPFLDVIPLCFALSEDTHYHVPLLVSPYGYSTYRGS